MVISAENVIQNFMIESKLWDITIGNIKLSSKSQKLELMLVGNAWFANKFLIHRINLNNIYSKFMKTWK